MTQFIPVTLSGNNLGQRHRQLNSLVRDAFQSAVPFESIQDLPEVSPVDRLFKIDLASQYRNVDYIIKNLKDTDMLYISRALKCTWLLETEYENKINANFLENELFPEMTRTAFCKMQQWIQHHLRDPERCKHFYNYYKEKQFKIAIKFLWHCSSEYIFEEFKNIIDRIDPNNLKVLSEKCPRLTRIFYENLELNQNILKHYLDKENLFFVNIKFIQKSDPDTFFYVIEKYFSVHKFTAFGPDITKYIMLNHRKRFFCKPELYTSWLLDINILAKCLTPEEVKEVVFKLARAEYLEHWFTYKRVEPLIKRLDKGERVAFKKLIFVDKSFGDKTKEWPYTPPSSPVMQEILGYNLFVDKKCDSIFVPKLTGKRMLKKRCFKGSALQNQKILACRTLLDDLFDRYRFMSFEATLFELRKRIRAESKLQNREFMMLVLISKSGGREDSLRTLFELLSHYRNEPVHFRAAIVRSLVKRAFVWRLPDDMWGNLLQWAHGMGLDGGLQEIICNEGLHAVVLRNLLAEQPSHPVVLKIFFTNFTYFTQYSLTTAERGFLRTRLPKMLLEAAASETGSEKRTRLEQLLCTLEEYKIQFDKFPGVIEAIGTAAQENLDSTKYLLHRLFNARVARKQLFKENFSLIQNNASYINALRHDTSVIVVDTFKKVVEYESPFLFEQYYRKLVIYFTESGGLAEQFYACFRQLAEKQPRKCLARPLSVLAGKDLALFLKTLDTAPKKSAERSLANALRANAHKSRLRLDLNVQTWQTVGVKAIANLVCVNPQNQREVMVKKLLTWGRTIRLALALTESEDEICFAYKNMCKLRPGAALKMFTRYLNIGKFGSEFTTIWEIVKPLITELDYVKRPRLLKELKDVKSVPASIKPEYCVLVYQAYLKIDKEMALHVLSNIEHICYEVNEEFLHNIIKDWLDNELIADKMQKDNYYSIKKNCFYSRFVAKYLLLCDSGDIQRERLSFLEEPFFQRIDGWWKGPMDRNILNEILGSFLEALKYNKVFFDTKYVSCMPVFERILTWLHNMLAIEKWFDLYISLHLTMLYYKGAKICISRQPELFNGDCNNLDKAIEIFGVAYGKLIARDYEELLRQYFQSIRVIYREELMKYLLKYIDYSIYDQSKERFVIAVIKSILHEKEAKEAHFLAGYIFVEHEKNHFKYNKDINGILKILKDVSSDELQFCLRMQSDL